MKNERKTDLVLVEFLSLVQCYFLRSLLICLLLEKDVFTETVHMFGSVSNKKNAFFLTFRVFGLCFITLAVIFVSDFSFSSQ